MEERRGRIWLLKDGQLHGVPVVMGLDDGVLIEVRGQGLEEGDTVVVNMVNPQGSRGAGGAPQGLNPVLRPPGPRL